MAAKKQPKAKDPRVTIHYTGRSGNSRTFVSSSNDKLKAKYDELFAKYVKGEIRSITLDME